ncbi:fimbria/pilus periplasmic chaperone [Sphingomonas changnyeongensis]|uniref:Fimbria/pilus periplasmic chaperone n=1 Tax=Sphingomonas changnyeongensis TaxID=2698679 RepID=A0A7Z2NVD5_9SPHN|nr:fimbria/pilus periplasmic chaperone [Sphingomonas changnyeongensis]QHL90518.1 fimbria/pilus periplasmic chaperone [Sphingomonas changnyeongensis]
MIARIRTKLVILTALVMMPAMALAFDVVPTVTVMELPRDIRGATIVVSNPRTVPLPISVEIVEREVNEDGTEKQTPADELFRIFPAQAIIEPGKRQTIRVIWQGPALQKSRSFTLYAGEVPVDVTSGTASGVQRILRIGASVHVAPGGTTAAPRVAQAVPEGNGVRVTLANDGSRFIYMNDISLAFAGKTIPGPELARIAERTLLTPGSRRSFVIPDVAGTPELRVAD